MSWQQRIDTALAQRRESQTLRSRSAVAQGCGRWLERDGKRWRNFSSNDYLGLSQHPSVVAAWQEGARRYGVGSGGSGHITGYSEAHQHLERQLAQWLGYPRALLFISGFAANHAVISALAQSEDRLVADRLSHASLLEAASQSPAQLRRFAHNDTAALQRLLAKPCAGQQLVITEGVFSMDGDSAPQAEIAAATRQAGAWLMVDDAHGVGVTGDGGRGSCAQAQWRPELLVVTFGKAFGVSGAAVLCSEALADYLLQFARHLIYSTAMPPAQAMAVSAAQEVIASDEGEALRARLCAHIQRFRRGAAGLPLQLTDSSTAIQPLIVGDNAAALSLAHRLRESGFWVNAIRPPTVPPGTARLRLTLSAAHQNEDIDALLEVLHGIGE
ncbi:8-amino-7-oxononanoate synthase [Enterobacteriaceae bacterium 4M9]|nr:8-amino-7-oxononanoate synthase [Enterobacteriaceae bacterium 4M9]